MYGTCYRVAEDKEEDGMQVNSETDQPAACGHQGFETQFRLSRCVNSQLQRGHLPVGVDSLRKVVAW